MDGPVITDQPEDQQLEALAVREETSGDVFEKPDGEATAEKEEHAGENREVTCEQRTEAVDEKKPEFGRTDDGRACLAAEESFGEASSQEDTQSKQDEAETIQWLTHEFPESLYELLFTLQEGRRLNDQRCSFMLETTGMRRRCHSEPNTRRPTNRVHFSSMTSLQKEEFFDLVATAQARRLDDQRAKLAKPQPIKPKSRSFRGSLRQLSLVRREKPAAVPKEDLYNMILTTQAQGRLEDQRSRAPGPMDDEDFFSLLLRVQGGRMEEQRTELPGLLQT